MPGLSRRRIIVGGRVAMLLAIVVLATPGCALAQVALEPHPLPGITAPAAVFVADGAGNFQVASRMLCAICTADGYPIEVHTVPWSHGYCRIIADQVCHSHAQAEGRKLAATVIEYHEHHPDVPIYLVGHSAGSATIMAAAGNLPPGVVDRVILLSPALSTYYDLRPALQSVRRTVEVFYSPHDCVYLGLVTGVLGTSDRRWTAAAGRVGFCIPEPTPDAELYTKLHQRAWQPADRDLGNCGGHYGHREPDFLRAIVVPLLQPASD